ncbi:phosphoenolpyruvate--protein phosphotransferase [Paenibacillus lutimineralis]|uniref:Phosphoenolpyruvate-protein phosphotransferase n=2 Tax=Paenibacillus lutimineralis TaxID=2707005 RepID=A0A3Q9I797_9BACL|nr:phosphoenolpyruvate--protein phosphotransferase [Paenibacillus lutimineralis]
MNKGIGASNGYAVGTAYVIASLKQVHFDAKAKDIEQETERLNDAIQQSIVQVRKIAEKSSSNLDTKYVAIINSHLNFLNDPSFTGEAFRKIKEESISAERAISDITQQLYDIFSEFEDEFTKERAEDIRDVGERVLQNLLGVQPDVRFDDLPPNTILFAHDLKPSDTAQIDKSKVIAFVTETGGKTSHTAIIAKALGIAAVVGCSGVLQHVQSGDPVIVDGFSGEVMVSPDESALQKYCLLADEYHKHVDGLAHTAHKKVVAKDGRPICVAANIGNLEDLAKALKNGADGVGLFRTELLYMERTQMPSEEEQFVIYKEAAEMLEGKPLTIRTLDVGGDKSLPYLKIPKEDNPFLGLRAIRLCLREPDIFKTQLRAILRASQYGNIHIMFPMISCMEELKKAKHLLEVCRQELDRENIRYDRFIKVGMMIELPAAAITADDFAKEVDFFSIGTNDLTQYTLAVDRMNESISALYDSMHPAVLKLIRMTIDAAHRASIPCCMCGELASDERAAALLLEYGLDEFSVSLGAIAETKSILLKSITT